MVLCEREEGRRVYGTAFQKDEECEKMVCVKMGEEEDESRECGTTLLSIEMHRAERVIWTFRSNSEKKDKGTYD